MTSYIYTLTDPRNLEVRYVGVSKTPFYRLAQHIQEKYKPQHKAEWFLEMLKDGEHPAITVIEEVADADRYTRERFWIKSYSDAGCRLVNVKGNQPPKTETCRIIVDVDADFHKQVKQIALERDKTVKQLVTECLALCISADVKRLAQPAAPSK